MLRNIATRKSDKYINLIIFILVICLGLVLYLRFTKKRKNYLKVNKIENILLITPGNKEIEFKDILGHDESYILFFELSNCPPCIFKGLKEIRELKKRGKNASVVVIHNWIDEWKHWTRNVDFNQIYMLKKRTP